jgi:hypothetical protein
MKKKASGKKSSRPRSRSKASKRKPPAKSRKPKASRPPADEIKAIRERLKAAILELDRKAPPRP